MALLVGGIYLGCGSTISFAQAQSYTFDIPSQALALSLRDYAKLSGQQIIFTENLVAGKTAPALQGNYSAEEALSRLMSGSGLVAVHSTSGIAMIQKEQHALREEPPPHTPAAPSVMPEVVVVTGSRLISSPTGISTPVETYQAEDLLRQTPESLPAALERLPQFTMTAGMNNYGTQAGTPGAGNYLNLRGLGAIEELTLLDGKRLPATSFNNTVDANIIPQAFVSRVEVVTGGASATYGSDAVSGVVNFILDKNFNGVKGSLQGGLSTYGDDAQLKVSLAGGMPFANGYGHIEASYDHFQQPGVSCPRLTQGDCSRPNAFGYGLTGSGISSNPYVLSSNLSENNATYGTLITSASDSAGRPVAFAYTGYQFGTGGAIEPFSPGTPTNSPNFSSNGQGAVSFGTSLTASLASDQGYGRVDYEIAPETVVYGTAIYSQAKNSYVTVADGSQINAFHVFQDNAFLPAGVAQAMAAQGVAYFTGSRFEADQTPKQVNTLTSALVLQAGAHGKLGSTDWQLDIGYGSGRLSTAQAGNFQQDKWYAALDAVRDSSGDIVCRVTLTNPGLYPGCVPWDAFGNGSPSQASYDYIEGTSRFQVQNLHDEVSGQVSGKLLDLPAGAVTIAGGFDYRYEQLRQTSNTNPGIPISQTGLCHAVDGQGAPTGTAVTPAQCNAENPSPGIVSSTTSPTVLQFSTTNVGPTAGEESIGELFTEMSLPLLQGVPYLGDLSSDLAFRYTQYSISGPAETWKLGAIWKPLEDLRLRGTMSRDFRAPSLSELFAGQSAVFGLFNDALHSGQNADVNSYTAGNPNLKPEIGNTSIAGLDWSPAYVDGLAVSLDYYTIRITNQIARLSSTVENQLCERSGGTDPICADIVRPQPFSDRSAANFPSYIIDVPYNQASVSESGFTLDVIYILNLGSIIGQRDASLNFHATGNYLASLLQYTGIGGRVIQEAGAGNFPKVKVNLSADFVEGPVDLGAGVRIVGADYYSHDPTVFYSYNGGLASGAIAYLDLNAAYNFRWRGYDFSAYLNLKNAFNTSVFVPNSGLPNEYYPSNQAPYVVVGRYFVAGMQFRG